MRVHKCVYAFAEIKVPKHMILVVLSWYLSFLRKALRRCCTIQQKLMNNSDLNYKVG